MEAESEVEALEVCLNGLQLAICTAGMCGNEVARGAFVRALAKFSMLGSGKLLEFRHIRCTQTKLLDYDKFMSFLLAIIVLWNVASKKNFNEA